MSDVNAVLKIAEAEVGYLEKKSNSQLDDKTANAGSNNYTKYGKEMHDIYPAVMDFPAAWCDAFVDWCFYKAYGVANAKALLGGNFDDYTPNSANLYKKKNAYIKRGSGTPKPGDQIFFNNGTRICHTGLVYKVDSKKVYTIEGNTSGASGVIANGGGVCKKSYDLTYSKIDGYGRPKYDNSTIETPSAAAPVKTDAIIFNSTFYNNKYTDLKNAFKGDATKLANHFSAYGMKEGRQGSKFFNPQYYKNKYADLQKAFSNDWLKYYNHFLTYGIKEGRRGSEEFDIQVYKNTYVDLQKAFKDDYRKYYDHYIAYGEKEGRKCK